MQRVRDSIMCTHKQTIYERFRNAWEEDIINNSEGEKITQVTDKTKQVLLIRPVSTFV